MADYQLIVDCRGLDDVQRELLAGQLWDFALTGIEELDDRLVAGFTDAAEADTAAAEIGARATVRQVASDSYLDAWRDHVAPSLVGNLFIRPAWIEAAVPKGAIEIVLDPGRAFGSGLHASTQLALELLQAGDGVVARSVLDVGCGSGVLAIAAAKLGAAEVVAVDIDDAAVANCRENVDRNSVGGIVTATSEPISQTSSRAQRRGAQAGRAPAIGAPSDRFDLVLINVLPVVHRSLAVDVRRVAREVIAAGFFTEHIDEVLSYYGSPSSVSMAQRDSWAAMRWPIV